MESVDKNISTILDIEPASEFQEETSAEEYNEEIIPIESGESDVSSDYETTRSNLYELLYKNQSALDGILEVAKQTDAPRAYEVVSQLVKQQTEINKDIIDLHLKMKELNSEDSNNPTNVNNTLFIGSTAELQKLLKDK